MLMHLGSGGAGPLFTHSMFKPESIWGQLGRWAHSKRHMEMSMFFMALDREVSLRLRQLHPASVNAPQRHKEAQRQLYVGEEARGGRAAPVLRIQARHDVSPLVQWLHTVALV